MWKTVKQWFTKTPRSYTLETHGELRLKPPVVSNWRSGMWVVFENKPAILHKVFEHTGELHFVDEKDGTTVLIVQASLNSLRQALFQEIPECRRGFSEATAKELGYGT